MSDAFTDYETGLNRLLTRLGRDHPRYTEALVLQQRLLENLARVRLYGDTETSRAERAQVFDALNRLTLGALGDGFSSLFLQGSDVATPRGSSAGDEEPIAEQREGDHFETHIGSVTGPVHTGTGDIILEQRVDTGGGAYIGGNVQVKDSDFVGRDRITITGDSQVVAERCRQALETARKTGDGVAEGAARDNLGGDLLIRQEDGRLLPSALVPDEEEGGD